MLSDVVLAGLSSMIHCMDSVTVSQLRVMARRFVRARLVMLRGFAMVMRCLLVVISRFLVVLDASVFGHWCIPSSNSEPT
jgi:hypothetical protein